jgi:dCTP deaminase
MGFLRDKDIIGMVGNGMLVPIEFNPKAVTPNGYDLSIDPVSIDVIQEVDLGALKGRVVYTKEYLKIPKDVMAILHLRSRFSRVGGFGSFGLVDAGFEGKLQFCIYLPEEVWEHMRTKEDTRMVQIAFYKFDGGGVEKAYAERSGVFQKKVATPEISSWGVIDLERPA